MRILKNKLHITFINSNAEGQIVQSMAGVLVYNLEENDKNIRFDYNNSNTYQNSHKEIEGKLEIQNKKTYEKTYDKTYENLEKVLTFVNKNGYNEYNNKDTLIVSCPNQMLAATLFAWYKCIGVQMLLATLLATNKCVGGQMLIKIYLFGGRFFVRNEVKMKDVEITETLKQEIIETSMNVVKLAKKGINIPFYDIIEMKNILLENKNTQKFSM